MKLALTQMDIVWENKEKNREVCDRLVREAADAGAQLILFPEMTLTGFTMRAGKFQEKENGSTERFFMELSEKYGISIVFGWIEEQRGKPFNLLEMVCGKEVRMKYAKIHPFSHGGEGIYYGRGEEVVSAGFGQISMGGFICYDLRFPEVFQISSKKNQVIFVIANWPESRAEQWDILLRARAIENQCFMIGINRVGEGNGLFYRAGSQAYDPQGNCIVRGRDGEELIYAEFDAAQAERYRREFPVKADRREELYKKIYN